jgi:hypothetical protein
MEHGALSYNVYALSCFTAGAPKEVVPLIAGAMYVFHGIGTAPCLRVSAPALTNSYTEEDHPCLRAPVHDEDKNSTEEWVLQGLFMQTLLRASQSP